MDINEHPHVGQVRAYLDNAGITPETLRYAATHESLSRSWIFDLLMGLADTMERPAPSVEHFPECNEGCNGDDHLLLGEDG